MVFSRSTPQDRNAAIIAGGKARFLRKRVLLTALVWAVLLGGLHLAAAKPATADGKPDRKIIISLFIFPIGVLGGYIRALRRWKEITGEPQLRMARRG